jgi:hypothetical protein
MTALRASAALLLLGLVAGTAACGDDAATPSAATATSAAPTPEPTPTTNGIDTMPAEEALASAKDAFLKATAVHIRGKVVEGDEPLAIDLRLASNGDADAKVTRGLQKMHILVIGDDVWVSGNRAFLTDLGGSEAYGVLKGRYVRTARDSSHAKPFMRLIERRVFADDLLITDGIPDGQELVNGVPAQRFNIADSRSVYFVALVGEPYPLRVADTDEQLVDFLEYGKPLDLKPPPPSKVVDIP